MKQTADVIVGPPQTAAYTSQTSPGSALDSDFRDHDAHSQEVRARLLTRLFLMTETLVSLA